MRTTVTISSLLAASLITSGCSSSSTGRTTRAPSVTAEPLALPREPASPPRRLDDNLAHRGSPLDEEAGLAERRGAKERAIEGTKLVTTLTDGEVIAIESTLHDSVIELAELARETAAEAQVRDFAAMVAEHHRHGQQKLDALARTNGMSAVHDDLSNKLAQDTQVTLAELRKRRGRDFDHAYLEAMIKHHRDAIAVVERQLLPSVKSSNVKYHLTTERRILEDELSRAESAMSALDAPSASRGGWRPT